ncbi:MAG TPA: NAD(P)/FAD-dependent oxidoreductase, partial [Mycobacterium sp.]
MGVRLGRAGYAYDIFDRAGGFGGTWRHNTYPGAACDVPSHLYSFSFALNPSWSKTYADQPEILAYLEKVASEHGLTEHFHGDTRITTLRWSDTDHRWTLTTDAGASLRFDIVVSAVGMLDIPNIPDIPIWVSPRFDEPFSPDQQDLFARDPDALRQVRQSIFDQYESASFLADSKQTREATDLANGYLERKVADPALRAKLTPSYPVGCKRPLLSRD